ncbi:MAG: hypothetical protein KDH94_05460 [Coxiellaceae bacterium]|nr:hypothetical protein [Coxiellaceae bacterium]
MKFINDLCPRGCNFYYEGYLTRDTFGPIIEQQRVEQEQQSWHYKVGAFFAAMSSHCRSCKKTAKASEDPMDYTTVFDHSKILITMGILTKLKRQHATKELVVRIYDDSKERLTTLLDSFERHPDLLPINTTIQCYHCVNESDSRTQTLSKLVGSVTGSNPHLETLDSKMLSLATKATEAQHPYSKGLSSKTPIDVAEYLQSIRLDQSPIILKG